MPARACWRRRRCTPSSCASPAGAGANGGARAETLGTDFRRDQLIAIAHGHLAERKRIEAMAPALIVEDTDIVTTCAWDVMLHGVVHPELAAIPATADLYLLFRPDVPWVPDGTRAFGGALRPKFANALRDELDNRGITPVIVGGDWDAREAQAVAAITAAMAKKGTA
jgi:nicotinamide riboside kinase